MSFLILDIWTCLITLHIYKYSCIFCIPHVFVYFNIHIKILMVWFWWEYWKCSPSSQSLILMDRTSLSSCVFFSLICGCAEWLVSDAHKNNDNKLSIQPLHTVSPSRQEREREGGAELTSDTRYPLSFLSAMRNYKPVRVRTSSYSTSKDKWRAEGIPQQGIISPVLPHFPLNPGGRGVKRSNHCPVFAAPPCNPLRTPTFGFSTL